MPFNIRAAALGIAAGLAFATAGQAAPVLDQEYDAFAAGADSAVLLNTNFAHAQSFTVGIAGQLTSMELQIRKTNLDPPVSDLTFDILSFMGGIPSGPALASGSIAAASVPDLDFTDDSFVSVDLSSFNIFVGVGEVLAIALTYLDSGSYNWLSTPVGNFYGAGSQFVSLPPGPFDVELVNGDLGFRTFVDPDATAPVPEPGTLATLAFGLLVFGFARRQRFKSRPAR